jgi:hypothetical protein
MHYRPPSKRDVSDEDLDTLHETVMPWMVAPLARWLRPFVVSGEGHDAVVNLGFIEGLEMAHRMRVSLNRQQVMHDIECLLESEPMFGIDAAAFALSTILIVRTPERSRKGRRYDAVEPLDHLLARSGSVWQVTEPDVEGGEDGLKALILTRRDLAAAKPALAAIRSQDARAGRLLTDAWTAIATRDPRPGEAYDKAVKAIEVAAHPVVEPNRAKATLGSIIGTMNADPAKWSFILGDIQVVIDLAQRVWKSHLRHGTQGRDENTPAEAEAAVYAAIALVRYFLGGMVKRTS